MFTQITVTTSQDSQGNQFTSVRRYDNHTRNTGSGRLYHTGNTARIHQALRNMGFRFMHRTANGSQWGKLLA